MNAIPTVLSQADGVVDLALALVDIPSVSGGEKAIVDAIEEEVRRVCDYEVLRDGDTLVVRTNFGREKRVVLAGHVDTVPIRANVPGRVQGDFLHGRGSVDMKAGCAVFLQLLRELSEPKMDVTWVFYDHEEVAADLNGLGRTMKNHPTWIGGDFAILGEPTAGGIEGGCNGTMRLIVTTHGQAAHSARPWMGENAVHGLEPVLNRLANWPESIRTVGGLDFRESLLAVGISGGGPRNVVPDEASVIVNFRFAPDRTEESAHSYVRSLFADLPVTIEVTDSAPAAAPGLDVPEFAELAQKLNGSIGPKLGWTDVARFSQLAIPAINCGPGAPTQAHQDREACPIEEIESVYRAFSDWLA